MLKPIILKYTLKSTKTVCHLVEILNLLPNCLSADDDKWDKMPYRSYQVGMNLQRGHVPSI